MITYELAKQLKHAGYSQELGDGYFLDDSSGLGNEQVYIPTLSELIESFDDSVIVLTTGKKMSTVLHGKTAIVSQGSTPEEAVTRLYIALNMR